MGGARYSSVRSGDRRPAPTEPPWLLGLREDALTHARTLLIVLAFALFGAGYAQGYTFEVHTGNSAHAPNTLHVHQAGHAPVSVTNATYSTRPFSHLEDLLGFGENYYSLRAGYFPQAPTAGAWDYGVELEFLHDKAYFESGDDPSGVIEHFELSDGLNQLLFNVAARYPMLAREAYPGGRLHLLGRAGLGPTITAPATIIRGQESGTRGSATTGVFYAMAGPGAQAAAQLRYFLTPYAAFSIEAKASIAHTRNPIAEGRANATFHGAHINLGLTFQTR